MWVHLRVPRPSGRSTSLRAPRGRRVLALRWPAGHEGGGGLKEELEARGEARSGNKAWLRRRLHTAIVRKYLEDATADEEA